MPGIYALLVGINQYPGNLLQGCVNDAKAVEQYLKTSITDSSATQLHIKSLTDESPELPTRQGIIDAFRFFEPAGKDDICLFYYSGHGSYAAAPEVIESDNGFVQSFVCMDSRSPGGRDLADKEMSFLIWKTMLHKPDTFFVAITDCCHSGTITKSFLDNSGITDRMAPPQLNDDKIENYLGYGESIDGKQAYEINASGMVKCIRMLDAATGKTLLESTDLVLAFDYENLNTRLEETARLLQERLDCLGIKAGSGKQLTIIAHSMGGLVSRLFIEKEDGHEVVSRLIMLGTPNNGTPWADVRDLAEILLTFALNGASLLKPWTMLLSGVGKLVKVVLETLKQMDPVTGIYPALNTGKDPGIPYFIVAGNTQSIAPVFRDTDSAVQRLLRRLKGRTAYDLLDTVLFKAPNDIAVTNTSILDLEQAKPWQYSPQTIIVACDHLNYFTHPETVTFLNSHIK